ncbi:hypothetical protein RvY_08146-2 [Ramazzottius varieornatus]|uniref:Nucleoporin NUP42 n=1 Tax=Ramazzottius varieornatus TaxID=947166 RepID=A0A1D1VAI7_RAMVA|nr:hypothetical protein RvY_08146-2 [Ramazzottius varieornatus]
MVVCKYFMQGRCQFGDNCRYEHPANESYDDEDDGYSQYSNGSRYSEGSRGGYRPHGYQNQQRFSGPGRGQSSQWQSYGPRGGNPRYENPASHFNSGHDRFSSPFSSTQGPSNAAYPPPVTETSILEDIRVDITNMWSQTATGAFQQGKIWPFTVYTYNVPDGSIMTDPLFDFPEFSPEELRLQAYQVAKDPTAAQTYISEVNALRNACRLKCSEIVNAASAGNPNTMGAKTILTEVRTKAEQHKARIRQEELGRVGTSPFQSAESAQTGWSFGVQTPNGQPSAKPTSQGVYSDTDMLTTEDFLQFASPEFTYGKRYK